MATVVATVEATATALESWTQRQDQEQEEFYHLNHSFPPFV